MHSIYHECFNVTDAESIAISECVPCHVTSVYLLVGGIRGSEQTAYVVVWVGGVDGKNTNKCQSSQSNSVKAAKGKFHGFG